MCNKLEFGTRTAFRVESDGSCTDCTVPFSNCAVCEASNTSSCEYCTPGYFYEDTQCKGTIS